MTKDEARVTQIQLVNPHDLDTEMGVIELVTPHVKKASDEIKRLERDLEKFATKAITKPVVILSEDEDGRLLRTLACSSGVTDFEVLPYDGCGNVKAASIWRALFENEMRRSEL